ncbi:unnamed protein product [Rhizoctonia solani]|uniref:BTB domain-containing protein n=1 Tax=Rhizoctonia solani TaxID=456999 RepID=A0A8H3CT52_9AGAM|nr:unnamed protein product [Rhizoctonia solani]
MAQEYEQKYTIYIQGREFTLRRSQIEFDSPNYFTTCFLGDFREAETRRIELYRDPDLFRIVISYLNGYVVLPLNEKSLPGGASLRPTLLNLRADAQFYQLDGLLKACDEELNPAPKERRKDRFIVLGFDYRYITVDDDMFHEPWRPIKKWPIEAEWQTYVTEDALGNGPLAGLVQLEPSQQNSLELMGAIERLASHSIKDYDPRRHKFIGWNETGHFQHEEYADYDVRVVYEDTAQ